MLPIACGSDSESAASDDGGANGYDATTEGGGDDLATGGDSTMDASGGDGGSDMDAISGEGGSPSDGGPDQAASDGSCPPATACPPNVTCGHYVDPCTGNVLVCGTPCPGGQTCVGVGGVGQSCQTPSCAGKCGVVGVDGCGVPISCGGCPMGQSCVNNQCVPSQPIEAGTCPPLTCTPDPGTNLCGSVTDGCGHVTYCACPAGQQCFGGVCGQTPPECTTPDGGVKCGSVPNACGSGNVQCGGCTGNNKCVSGTCTPCTPPVCNGATCGQVSNGCGSPVSCGTCGNGETCHDGGCCTPLTCAEAIDSGVVTGCDPVDLGCGVRESCAPCKAGMVCQNDKCTPCIPKTCADFGDAGCGHYDGCGKYLDCCPAGLACQGVLCCPYGQVDYNGTCCQPKCDPNLGSGPQFSCGVYIYCQG
jgi:hypothetical protein